MLKDLSSSGITQLVWVPHKKYHVPDIPTKIKNVEYYFTGYQDIFDRILFHRKTNKGIRWFENLKKSLSSPVVHAHTLFSDGALAYEIHRKSGTPYIVTVRNTDVNIFWKYFPHLHSYGRRIAQSASAITFIGPTYRNRMVKFLFPKTYENTKPCLQLIPNGLDPFWLSNHPERKKTIDSEIRVLFVGVFKKQKNIKTIVESCNLLRGMGKKLSLRLVGAKKKVDFSYSESNSWIEVLPFSKNKRELAAHYRWADVFVMPSFTETFGLVYAEALSQGTPVIYTKGQGFDGWIDEGVCGHAVSPKNVKEIAKCIATFSQQHCENGCVKSSKIFNWKNIAEKYLEIYKNART